jgi:abequosyltransferase
MSHSLSIVIATYNRGKLIADTLNAIIPQLNVDDELLVVDGASTDNTSEVVDGLFSSRSNCRYIRLPSKGGVDYDYCVAVSEAKGDFCWLMSDDDIVREDALHEVRSRLGDAVSLVVVNGRWVSTDLKRILIQDRLSIGHDRYIAAGDADTVMATCGELLSFIGAVVIRRSIWEAREKKCFIGTEFIHVGVIFQGPLPGVTIVVAEPLVTVRYGASQWITRGFFIWMVRWPGLIWSFDYISDASRARVVNREPWRNPMNLLAMKARGWFTRRDLELIVREFPVGVMTRVWLRAVQGFPNGLFNLLACLIASVVFRRRLAIRFELESSPFYWRNSVSRFYRSIARSE